MIHQAVVVCMDLICLFWSYIIHIQARAEGGGRRVLEHLPLCTMMPKVPFYQGIFYFILLNTLL